MKDEDEGAGEGREGGGGKRGAGGGGGREGVVVEMKGRGVQRRAMSVTEGAGCHLHAQSARYARELRSGVRGGAKDSCITLARSTAFSVFDSSRQENSACLGHGQKARTRHVWNMEGFVERDLFTLIPAS